MSDESSDDDFDVAEFELVKQNKLKVEGVEDDTVELAGDYTNNKVGLLARLEEFKQDDLPWIERLDFTTGSLKVDAHDDLKREAEFYEQSLRGVHKAIEQLDQARIPYVRPADFFAEMIKPDSQMRKIKDSLLREKLKMQTVEQRIKHKNTRKFSKKVHAERLEQKSRDKKESLEKFKKSKSGNVHNELRIERSVHGTIDDALKKNQQKKSKKRLAADAKYGFGGKKKRFKSNTADSADSFREFSVTRNKAKAGLSDKKPFAGRSKKKAGGKPNRPGKARRAAARS